MPSNKVHSLISEILFGESGKEVHKWMDMPVKYFGRHHRKYRHDPLTLAVLFIKDKTQGTSNFKHGAVHILTDTLVSKAENQAKKLIKKSVENFLKNIKQLR